MIHIENTSYLHILIIQFVVLFSFCDLSQVVSCYFGLQLFALRRFFQLLPSFKSWLHKDYLNQMKSRTPFHIRRI